MKSTLTEKCRWLVSRHARRFIQISVLATAASILAGCSTPSAIPSKRVVNDTNGNFHLYVFNRSFTISPVDIKVFIDGKLVVKGNFDAGSQHSYQPFVLKLSPGRHKIVAESSNGYARLKQTFEVKDKLWASLVYSYNPKTEGGVQASPPRFYFDVKKKPMFFL